MNRHSIIVAVLLKICPNAQWQLRGDDLSGLVWLDLVQPRPSDQAINDAVATYTPPPSLQDQLIALQAQVNTLGAK